MKKLMIGMALAGSMLGTAALAAQAQDGNDKGPGVMAHHGDANGDGTITREEFMARAAEHFARLDANKDGKITPDEMKAAMDARPEGRGMGPGMGMRHGRRGGPDGLGGPGGPGGPGMMPPPPPGGPEGPGGAHGDMLARLDANHDGKLSRAEFNAPGDKHFDMIDTNHDGQIDQAELNAEHERMRAMMQEMRAKWRAGRGMPDGPQGDMPPPPPPPPAGNNPGA